jgi:hypothetical protein
LGGAGAPAKGDGGVQRQFFSERQALRFLERYCPEGDSEDYPNVDGFFAVIVGERLASWRELSEYYTLEEALDMWEIIMTNRYNEWLAMQQAEKRHGRP